MQPSQVVRAALRGLDRRRPVCIPGWRNKLTTSLARLLPRRTIVTRSMKFFHPDATADDG
jgi:short-subunit dehydrogenase